MNARDLWLRLRALLWPSRVSAELADELDFHLEMQTRKHMAAGLEREAARRQARASIGRSDDACNAGASDTRCGRRSRRCAPARVDPLEVLRHD